MDGASKVALITGVTGQLGSFLVELLEAKGYKVHGLVRSLEAVNRLWYAEVYVREFILVLCDVPVVLLADMRKPGDVTLHVGTMEDKPLLTDLLKAIRPQEIYNFAALSNVNASWAQPEATCDVNALGLVRLLEAVRDCNLTHQTRILQAGTSEMFGHATDRSMSENTHIAPVTVYGASKAFAFWTVRQYRERYNMFAVNAILFNHESSRRGPTFRTHIITHGVANVVLNMTPCLVVDNLETRRDWSHVRDGVHGMWLSLQAEQADDYVFATGKAHTIRDFVGTAFRAVGRSVRWRGEGTKEVGIDDESGEVVVRVDADAYQMRSTEQQGDPSKAERVLGWTREESFESVVQEMMDHAMRVASPYGFE